MKGGGHRHTCIWKVCMGMAHGFRVAWISYAHVHRAGIIQVQTSGMWLYLSPCTYQIKH